MRNVSLLDDMIKEHDVDILKHLTDVKCILHSDEPVQFLISNVL